MGEQPRMRPPAMRDAVRQAARDFAYDWYLAASARPAWMLATI